MVELEDLPMQEQVSEVSEEEDMLKTLQDFKLEVVEVAVILVVEVDVAINQVEEEVHMPFLQ
jgi:hypothetical protein